MNANIAKIVEHRLEILTTLGLSVEGCQTREDLAKRILTWWEDNPERKEHFKDRATHEWVVEVLDYGDLHNLACEGFKGFDNYTDEEWLEEIEERLIMDDYKKLIFLLGESIEE